MSKELTPVDRVKGALKQMTSQFKAALPLTSGLLTLVRVAMTAMNQNPKLAEADRNTLYGAFMKCAQSGLLPDGKEAAIVTFGQNAQYMPMVAGILAAFVTLESSHRSRSRSKKNDKFRYHVDTDGSHLLHEPDMFAGPR